MQKTKSHFLLEDNPALASWLRVMEADEEALVRLVVPYVRWLQPNLVASLSHTTS